jgi:hypothetical protein
VGRRLGVIGSRRRNPRGGHVAVPDRLDLLEPVLGDEVVEGREDLVEQGDDILGRELLRCRREAGDVRKEDADLLAALGDDALGDLQALRDGAREDAEEEPLRALLLHRQQSVRAVAGANEVLEECKRRHGRAEHVEREERQDEPGGEGRVRCREELVDRGRHADERGEPAEPADGGPRPVEDERPERRDERPEGDGARFHEAAEAPLQQEGEDEDQQDLACPVEVVALRTGEEGEPQKGEDLVGEGDQRRKPEPERRVGRHPDAGERRDQERGEDERRLPQPLVGGVGG